MVQSPPDNARPGRRAPGHQAPRARFHLRDHPSRRLRGQCAPADRLRAQAGPIAGAPKRVLVIGASTGYGLAARISAAFAGARADPGRVLRAPVRAVQARHAWLAQQRRLPPSSRAEGLYARSINGDAFSDEIKRQVIEAIRADLGQVDQVVYSLAAPRAQPSTRRQGHLGAQARGPRRYAARPDTDREVVRESTLEPATQDEIDATVAVMGGEDWQMWIDTLLEAGVLAEGATTTAHLSG